MTSSSTNFALAKELFGEQLSSLKFYVNGELKDLINIEIDPKKTVLEYFNNNYEKCLIDWCEKYPEGCTLSLSKGNFFTKLFTKEPKILLLNSIESIKEFSKNNSIANRPQAFVFDLLSHHYLGSYYRMHDSKLDEIRRITLNAFEENLIEDEKICNEIETFFTFLNEKYFETRSIQLSESIEKPMEYIQQLIVNLVE